MPIIGLLPCGAILGTSTRAMPCAAPAAFASNRRVNAFTPSRSATENIIVMSFTPT